MIAQVGLTLLLCAAIGAAHAVPISVTLGEPLAEGRAVYVSGPSPYLGDGDPMRSVRMLSVGAERWELPLDVPGLHSNTLRFYARPIGPAGLEAPGQAVEPALILAPGCPDVGAPARPTLLPAPRGDLSAPRRVDFRFSPKGFRPRRVSVLLPRGYDSHGDRSYPTLVALDGQNVFAPGGAFGSWDLDRTVTNLIDQRLVPGLILVAVANTPDRFAEYTPEWIEHDGQSGRGGAFLDALCDELLPMLRTRWRIGTEPGDIALIGSSLGGLLAVEAAMRRPDAIGAAIAISPSFWLAPDEYVRRAAEHARPGTRARLWIDSGTDGRSQDGFLHVQAVRDAFLGNGALFGPDFMHVTGIGDAHNEAAWRRRAPLALRWLHHFPQADIQP
jgi:predicted alpha/beta superfamily hydrolase